MSANRTGAVGQKIKSGKSGIFFAAEKHGANHHDFTTNHHKFTTFLPPRNTAEIANPH
jgi:hypothetical protein